MPSPIDFRDIANLFSAGFSPGRGSFASGAERIWLEAKQFSTTLLSAAAQRWLPFYAERHPCHVAELREGVPFQCHATSVLPCDVCRLPTCLNHAQVDKFGQGTCFACVVEMVQLKQGHAHVHGHAAGAAPPPPPPPPRQPPAEMDKIYEALKVLGLPPTASFKEVQSKHRKLAAKNHPDRARTAAAKAKAAAESIRVNSAFMELKKHFERSAA